LAFFKNSKSRLCLIYILQNNIHPSKRFEMTKQIEAKRTAVAEAKERWQAASIEASKLASTLFQPGSGYGDPDARVADEHKLQTAKEEAERLYREFNDLDRNLIDE
jgi:hypothetical protein